MKGVKEMKKCIIQFALLALFSSEILADNVFPEVGNVGIGTSKPKELLHVDGPILLKGKLEFEDKNGTKQAIIRLDSNNDVTLWNPVGGANNDIFLGTGPIGGSNIRMTVKGDGNVGIGTTKPKELLHVDGSILLKGKIEFQDTNGAKQAIIRLDSNNDVTLWNPVGGANNDIFLGTGPIGGSNIRMTVKGDGNVGIGTTRPDAPLDVLGKVQVQENSSGAGVILTRGPNGKYNVALASMAGNANDGGVVVFDKNEDIVAHVGFNEDGLGRIAVVHDGYELAIMDVYKDGNTYKGYIEADIKNFRVPNPKQPEMDIVYASIEGPEAAAYVRGTAKLLNGKAIVKLPGHFSNVITEKDITTHVTPLSAKSLGLAVVEKSSSRIIVKELQGGTGSYEFDWEVKSIRKGHENYKIVRPRRKPAKQYLTN